MNKINISLLIPVYNEEKKILTTIRSIPNFIKEIIVYDKGSTDKTLEILKSYPNVIVKKVAYSNRGEENYNEVLSFSKNDWVFFINAGEILPKRIFQFISQIIYKDSNIDLIMIPRKMYVFQVFFEKSPWGIQYYPFCFKKSKIKISKNIHEPFYVTSEDKRYFLPPNENTNIVHITHNSFGNYFNHIDSYIEHEYNNLRDSNKSIQKCKDQILLYNNLFKSNSVNKTIHFAAWSIYWNSIILRLLESKHNLNFEATDYNEFVNYLKSKKDYTNKLIKPSNFMIIYLKKLYRKHYNIKWIRLLKAKIIKT